MREPTPRRPDRPSRPTARPASRRSVLGSPIRSALLGVAATLVLAACDTDQPTAAGGCAYVDSQHLAVPRRAESTPLICDPNLVAPTYRERYFPDAEPGEGAR